MQFSSNLDRREVNPLMYVRFWRQACLPTLLFGAELFTLTRTLLLRLERCQSWFLKNIFYVPKFAADSLLQKLSGLNSIGSSENKDQSEAKGTLSGRRYCTETRREVLSLF